MTTYNIRDARQRLSLSQLDLESAIKLASGTICRIESQQDEGEMGTLARAIELCLRLLEGQTEIHTPRCLIAVGRGKVLSYRNGR